MTTKSYHTILLLLLCTFFIITFLSSCCKLVNCNEEEEPSLSEEQFSSHDHYLVLGVSQNSTTEEIESAYRKLVKQYDSSPAMNKAMGGCMVNPTKECLNKSIREVMEELMMDESIQELINKPMIELQNMNQIHQRITEAYEILSYPSVRLLYDKSKQFVGLFELQEATEALLVSVLVSVGRLILFLTTAAFYILGATFVFCAVMILYCTCADINRHKEKQH